MADGHARQEDREGKPGTLDPPGLARMQRSAGNAAVRLMVQRSVAAAPQGRKPAPLPLAQLATEAPHEEQPVGPRSINGEKAWAPPPVPPADGIQRSPEDAAAPSPLALLGLLGAIRGAQAGGGLGRRLGGGLGLGGALGGAGAALGGLIGGVATPMLGLAGAAAARVRRRRQAALSSPLAMLSMLGAIRGAGAGRGIGSALGRGVGMGGMLGGVGGVLGGLIGGIGAPMLGLAGAAAAGLRRRRQAALSSPLAMLSMLGAIRGAGAGRGIGSALGRGVGMGGVLGGVGGVLGGLIGGIGAPMLGLAGAAAARLRRRRQARLGSPLGLLGILGAIRGAGAGRGIGSALGRGVGMGGMLGGVGGVLGGLIGGIGAPMLGLAGAAGARLRRQAGHARGGLGGMLSGIGGVLGRGGSGGGNILQTLLGTVGRGLGTAGNLAGSALEQLGALGGGALQGAGGFAGAIMGALGTALAGAGGAGRHSGPNGHRPGGIGAAAAAAAGSSTRTRGTGIGAAAGAAAAGAASRARTGGVGTRTGGGASGGGGGRGGHGRHAGHGGPGHRAAGGGGGAGGGGAATPVVEQTPGAGGTGHDGGGRHHGGRPEDDPNFQKLKGQVKGAGKQSKAHASAGSKVAQAHGAAAGPANEVAAQAGAAQVDKMGEQKPKGFDKAKFIAAVKAAIDQATPKNLEEADDFKSSGKAGEVKGKVSGLVKGEKQESEADIKGATEETPDASKATPKQVTPMPAEQPGSPPPKPNAAAAMPPAASPQDVSLQQGKTELNDEMKSADVTEEQLKKSNEPEFQGALDQKKQAEKHADTAPGEYRKQEQQIIAGAHAEAETMTAHGLGEMHGKRASALSRIQSGKGTAKAADEKARAELAKDLEAIYSTTKVEVKNILDAIDPAVDAEFEKGEKDAKDAFEGYVGGRMSAYKDKRYSGWTGGLKWAKDKLVGMPDEVNVFFDEGKKLYLARMDGVISHIADIVGTELTKAKDRIAKGRQQIMEKVASLPANLKKVGLDAQKEFSSKFDQLEQDVDSKQDDLVQNLAQKYVESSKALDERIDEMKAENKGLVDKAVGAIKGVIETILKLKDMLLGVLKKAGNVISGIIKDPIGFLGKLISGVKGGLDKFVANIGTHLKDGLLGWLFGALADAGIEIPKTFDLKGIIGLILQVLGLTWANIRKMVVKVVGEPVMSAAEKTVDVFKTLITEGPAGLWKWIQDKFESLKETVFDAIKNFVITRIVMAGVTWLIGLLNPAAAFIKACKAIYDIVMFIVDRGSQIMEFVNSVLDSVGEILAGNTSKVSSMIENSLAKALPVAIGFLASLLGLGGITEKIKSIIETIRKPVTAIVNKLVIPAAKKVAGFVGKGVAFVKGKVTKVKDWAVAKGKAAIGKVKQKVGAAASWAGEKLGLIKVEKPFSMKEESHELTATASDGEADILIASSLQRRLIPLLETGQASLKAQIKGAGGRTTRKQEETLALVESGLALAKRGRTAIKQKWDQLGTGTRRKLSDTGAAKVTMTQFIDIELAQIAVQLGRLDSLKSLSSKEAPKQRWLPEGYKVRRRLYTRGAPWAAESARARQRVKEGDDPHYRPKDWVGKLDRIGKLPEAQGLAEVQKLIDAGKLPRRAVGAFKRGALDSDWVKPLLGGSEYHVDHMSPVAKHWDSEGWNCGDEARWSHATDQENLQVVTQEYNLSWGSKEEEGGDRYTFAGKFFVGPNFSSIYAEGGIPNAASIDEQPFRPGTG